MPAPARTWAKARTTAQCWWCQGPTQTRDHLFKVCPEWKTQQKALWAEVQKETGRWKSRWKIRDLLADKRCGQAVLDFLSSTDVGRIAPQLERGRWESGVRVGAQSAPGSGTGTEGGGAWCRGRRGLRGGTPAIPPHPPPFMASAGKD